VINPLVQDMRRISENTMNLRIGGNQEIINNSNNVNNNVNINMEGLMNFRQPIPLPLSHNDWSDIKEGFSYMYNSKIPINMKDLKG
jgi:hypothetical protein